MPGRKKRARRRVRRWVFALLFLLAVLAFFFYDSCTRLVTDETEFALRALPAGFDGCRVVQLSDLHGAVFGENNEKLAAAVRAAKPEYIFITGDLISNAGDLASARTLLEKLVRIAPVYFVTGNHEGASHALPELRALLDELGAAMLDGKYETLERGGETIVLAGVDDENVYAAGKTPRALTAEIREAEGDKFILLLSHRNDILDEYAAAGAGLVLTGHVHGGVIRLPGVGGLLSPDRTFFPDYDSGLYEKGGTVMFVSRGLGLVAGIPRFLNNPQVAVLTLRRAP